MSHVAEMGRLTKQLSKASDIRTAAIDEMRRATKTTLKTCAAMRGDMMHGYREQARRSIASLAKDASAHSRATTKQIMRLASARRKATSQLRADLEGQVLSIMERTAEIRNAAAAIGPTFATAHQAMAARQKASLDAGRRKLRSDVTRFLSSIRRHQQAVRSDLAGAHDVWSAFAQGEPAKAKKKREH